MPWITQMLFVGLNDIFSRQEFDSLLCNCSVKGCREKTMRKTTCRVCDVTSSTFPSAVKWLSQGSCISRCWCVLYQSSFEQARLLFLSDPFRCEVSLAQIDQEQLKPPTRTDGHRNFQVKCFINSTASQLAVSAYTAVSTTDQ